MLQREWGFMLFGLDGAFALMMGVGFFLGDNADEIFFFMQGPCE